jgi:uncharacterized protein YciI
MLLANTHVILLKPDGLMKHFAYKLIPPRPTFNLDMDDHEKTVMNAHMQYWAALFASKKVIVYGPVLDPGGVYGLAVVEVETDDEARAIAENDPAVSSQVTTFELSPMLVGLSR